MARAIARDTLVALLRDCGANGYTVSAVEGWGAKGSRSADIPEARRPAEELYDLRADPWQMNNVAGDARFAEARKRFRAELGQYLAATKDPRAFGQGAEFDRYFYVTGGRANRPAPRRP